MRRLSDTIRELYARYGEDTERICAEFEQAGLRGEIRRASNVNNQTWRFFARFLLDDGKRKGWICKAK